MVQSTSEQWNDAALTSSRRGKKEKEQVERLTRRTTYFIVTIKTECITWAAYFLSDTTTTVNLSCGTRGSSSCKSTGGTGIRLANDDPRDVDGSFADSDHCSKGNEQSKRIHHDGLQGNGLEKCLLITSLLCTSTLWDNYSSKHLPSLIAMQMQLFAANRCQTHQS